MKATLEFTLPEDRVEHTIAVHAMDFALVCVDLESMLRGLLRNGYSYSDTQEALEDVRRYLHHRLERRGVSLDMIE